MVDMLEATDSTVVLDRLFKTFNVSSDRQLSTALGLSLSSVGTNRTNNTLPYKAIVLKCQQEGISLDSLFGIDAKIFPGETVKSAKEHDVSTSTDKKVDAEQTMRAHKLVERVLERELYNLDLPADRILFAARKLRPILLEACFEHDFSESFVELIAKGAITMAT
jgi:hypothetical protein